MEYKVIYVTDKNEYNAVEKLEKGVKKYICAGWKPIGGVSISNYYQFREIIAAQAMIKE